MSRKLLSVLFVALVCLSSTGTAQIISRLNQTIDFNSDDDPGILPRGRITDMNLRVYVRGNFGTSTVFVEVSPWRDGRGIDKTNEIDDWVPIIGCEESIVVNTECVGVGTNRLRVRMSGTTTGTDLNIVISESVLSASGGNGGNGDVAIALDWAPQDGILNVFDILDGVTFDLNNNGSAGFSIKQQNPSTVDLLATSYTQLRFNPLGSAIAGAFAPGVVHGPSVGTMIGGAWRNVIPTETVPTGVLISTDLTTGLGYSAVGGVAIIDNAILVANFTTTGLSVSDGLVFEFPESATPPATTESDSWYDPVNDVVMISDGTNDLVLTPRLGGELDNIIFVIDTAVPPDQDVHVFLFNSIGLSIDTVPHCYLTDDPGGVGESADTPSAITPGINQFLTQIGTDLRHFFLASNAIGEVDLIFNESGGPSGDSYRLACLVDGTKFVSGLITPRP